MYIELLEIPFTNFPGKGVTLAFSICLVWRKIGLRFRPRGIAFILLY